VLGDQSGGLTAQPVSPSLQQRTCSPLEVEVDDNVFALVEIIDEGLDRGPAL
jgi:hypothetical protein